VRRRRPGRGGAELAEPAVRARYDGDGVEPGAELTVVLVDADPARRAVRFAPAA
jgi:RNase II-type exonuclease C-terminal S1 domain